MLKELVKKYGKEKINTLTKYPSILTLHKMGEKGMLLNELTTPITSDDEMFSTEKIDGTNTRIIVYKDEFLIGSREFILHHCDDLYFDPSQGIVEGIRDLGISHKIPMSETFMVIYGEFFGGKVSSNSKWYGQDKIGYRVFDVAFYKDLSVLEGSLPEISHWREHETENGIVYGQDFVSNFDLPQVLFPSFERVPEVPFELGDMSHETVLNNLRKFIPSTNVALSDNALKRAEGVVLRNRNRTKIVKLRFEDYERTLRVKK